MCNPAAPVLLVEDEVSDAMLFKRAFGKALNWPPVIRVANGDEAVDYLDGIGAFCDRNQYPLPSIVVLDIKLPRRGGFEVLESIRTRADQFSKIPVIMLSSSNRLADIQQSYEKGANSYVIKPYTADEYAKMAMAIVSFWMTFNEQASCPRVRH